MAVYLYLKQNHSIWHPHTEKGERWAITKILLRGSKQQLREKKNKQKTGKEIMKHFLWMWWEHRKPTATCMTQAPEVGKGLRPQKGVGWAQDYLWIVVTNSCCHPYQAMALRAWPSGSWSRAGYSRHEGHGQQTTQPKSERAKEPKENCRALVRSSRGAKHTDFIPTPTLESKLKENAQQIDIILKIFKE